MKKKKTGIMVLAAAVLVIGAFLLYRYTPGKERMELTEYYGLEEGETAVIINSENTGITAVKQEGAYYLPVDMVQAYLNERFYWDGTYLLYTLPDRTVSYIPGETAYFDGTVETENRHTTYDGSAECVTPGCMMIDGTLWVDLHVVAQYTNMTWAQAEDPNRIWIWNQWEQMVAYAQVEKDSVLRYRAGIKSPILADLSKGDRVLILDESIKGWVKVQTTEGIMGYLPDSRLSEGALHQPVHDFAEPEYAHLSIGETVVMAWHQNLDNSGIYELPDMLSRSSGMNVIAPSWFTLSDDTGNFISRADAAYTQMAHEAGVAVWAMIDNLNLPVNSYQVLSVTENRTRLISGLISEALASGIDGINVDFESLSEACGVHFSQFIRELSVACHQAGLVLSVDNYAPQSGTGYYNRAEQALYADYIMVMAYDEHWKGSEAGSTSSYPFVTESIEGTLAEVPAEKLILAIPFYTRLWTADGDSRAIGMAQLSELLTQWEKPEWLEEERQYFAAGMVEDEQVSVWIEDLETLAWRLELADGYGLAGVSAWKAGLELPEAWELLEGYGED